MTLSKVSCSILFVSASLLGCSTIISSITHQGGRIYSDGGAPQPPVPTIATPKPIVANLVADGGAPQPPVPKPTQRLAGPNLVADGGAPQPPVPPKASPRPVAPTLVADGGAPQPPVPKLNIAA